MKSGTSRAKDESQTRLGRIRASNGVGQSTEPWGGDGPRTRPGLGGWAASPRTKSEPAWGDKGGESFLYLCRQLFARQGILIGTIDSVPLRWKGIFCMAGVVLRVRLKL